MITEIEPRYVIHAGYVTSRNDGDRHYISYQRLIDLYGVRGKHCVDGNRIDYREQAGDVHLRPSWDGNYSIPSA